MKRISLTESAITTQADGNNFNTAINKSRKRVWAVVILDLILLALDAFMIFDGRIRLQCVPAVGTTLHIRKIYNHLYWISQDLFTIALSIVELNALIFYRESLFVILIILTLIASLAQIGSHGYVIYYEYVTQKDSLLKYLSLGAAFISVLIFCGWLSKCFFVKRRMLEAKEQLNLIKDSVLSDDHFKYALKKSLAPK